MLQMKTGAMASPVNCGVCARPLIYATESVAMKCSFCGKEDKTPIYCPEGHYICDTCHSKAAMDVLRQVLADTKSKDPAEILEQVMSHPSVPMHGPEHHAIVPGVIVAAVRNSGYPIPEGAVEKALERASKVQGGWCGLYGDCGAAVGVGIAVSVITGATPLTGKPRTQSMKATVDAMSQMLDEQARCCKRASRTAVRAATEFLRENLGVDLPNNMKVRCRYLTHNLECSKTACPFFK
jgi:7,8-dihydro-6-hydroxymethylpterin dimethyltransferase